MEEEQEVTEWPIWNLVLALAAPFFVWPVEILLPFPYIVEELAKLLLVFKPARANSGWVLGAGVGFLFGLSETMLYVVNAILIGKFGVLGMRLLLTLPMHVLTATVIYIGARKSGLATLLGLLLGIWLHWIFNRWASGAAFLSMS